MPKIRIKGREYTISESELQEIKENSRSALEVKELFDPGQVLDTFVTIWDNFGREMAIYTAERIIDRIISRTEEESN